MIKIASGRSRGLVLEIAEKERITMLIGVISDPNRRKRERMVAYRGFRSPNR